MISDVLTSTARMMDIVDILSCYYIYNVCNGKLWEPITCTDFIAILNMKQTGTAIKVRYREKSRVCYLLFKLSKKLAFPLLEKDWLKAMLEAFDISPTYYRSHYSDVKAYAPGKDNEKFEEKLKEALSDAERAKPTT